MGVTCLLKFMFCIIVLITPIYCQVITDDINIEVDALYEDQSGATLNNIEDIPFDIDTSTYMNDEIPMTPEDEMAVAPEVESEVTETSPVLPQLPRNIPSNSVVLRNINGIPLTAEDNGELSLNREEPTDWEHWIIELKNNKIAFKSHHGKYLSAQVDGSFVANRLRFGPWETFELIQYTGNNKNDNNVKINKENTDSNMAENIPEVSKLLIRTSHRKYMVLGEEAVGAQDNIPASSLSLQRASDDRALYSEEVNIILDMFGI